MTLDSSKIKTAIILLLALFAALYLGIAAATAQLEAIAWVAGTLSVVVCLTLGRRIWLIIPLLSSLGFRLPLPGTISTMMVAQMAVLGMFALLFLMRKLPFKFRFTELEGWSLLFGLCVLQAYLRNPVGLNLFGASTVGGRPYVEFALTYVTAFSFFTLIVSPKDIVWWVRLTMIGSTINFVVGALAMRIPLLGKLMGASFGTAGTENTRVNIDPEAAGRVSYVRGISYNVALWISSLMSPLKALFHPLWGGLVLFTMVAAAYSGYRSQIAVVALAYLGGLYYRGGIPHLVMSGFGAAMAIALLAFVNLLAPLPPNIQRSLTFLPGTWEQRYKDDTKVSNDWRTEIWIEALTSEKYISNKFIGDGLGMTAEQYQKSVALADSTATGVGGWDAHRESILISGDYHSGPVQTIRTVGYFGLLVVLIGMIRVAVHAHRQILRCRGTEWYPTALFLGIPAVTGPVFWVFVFGSFDSGAAYLLMGAAMIRLLENNLPLPAYVHHHRLPYILRKQPTPANQPVKQGR